MKIVSLFLILITGFTSRIICQTLTPLDNPEEFLNKIKEVSLATKTLKADFTEEKFSSYLKELQKSTGVFYFKKENNLRWEKIKPAPYILLVNGSKLRLKENGKEVNVSAYNQMIGGIKDLMLSLINGDFHKSKDYKASYFTSTAAYVVHLKPKNKKLASVFDHIELVFSKDKLRLQQLTFFEKSGDKSVMKFFNDVANGEVDSKLFSDF